MSPEKPRILNSEERELKNAIGKMLGEIFERCNAELEKKREKRIATRIHRLRNNIAIALCEKHPVRNRDAFLAYDFLIGSTERICNTESDFPEPGAMTTLKRILEAIERGQLQAIPEDITRWVRKCLKLSNEGNE